MSISKINLSVSFSSVQLGLQAPLQEFPAGRAQSLPESIAAGGTAFQQHRRMQVPCCIVFWTELADSTLESQSTTRFYLENCELFPHRDASGNRRSTQDTQNV